MIRPLVIAAPFLLAACASGGTSASINAAGGGLSVSERSVFETLPPQDIAPSQCPMVLYSRAGESRRLFIGLDNPPMALVRINGRTIQFARASTNGASTHRHFEQETYASPDGAQLTAIVRFTPLPGDASGAAIRSASLAYTSPEGETAIVPAVGLVSCPASN